MATDMDRSPMKMAWKLMFLLVACIAITALVLSILAFVDVGGNTLSIGTVKTNNLHINNSKSVLAVSMVTATAATIGFLPRPRRGC